MTIPDSLSTREKEVAALLLQGKSNKQIAQALGVATRTVEFHLSHIFEKLGVNSRAEAIIKLNEPPAVPDLRESTAPELREPAADLRASTVVKAPASSENDGNLVLPMRRIKMRKILFFIGLGIVACVSLSALCVLSTYPMYRYNEGSGPSPRIGIVERTMVVELIMTPIQPTPTAWQATYTPVQPTPQPEATGVIPRQFPSGPVSYEGVSFALDPELASGADGLVLLETAASPDSGWWEPHPQYVRLALQGYKLPQSAHQPVIAVYPVEDYRRISPQAAQTLDDLKARLAQSTPVNADTKLPLLPPINAGQVIRSNVQRLSFQNGSGLRYLTLYAQYPAPVNNQDLFYTFQGLTSDGRHVVSIILPVSHPSLPASADALSQAEAETLIKDPTYYPQSSERLTTEAPASFTPDLTKLDALVTSLKIDR